MKIRSDFVTNSSSSNFTLIISFALTNKKKVTFKARGADQKMAVGLIISTLKRM